MGGTWWLLILLLILTDTILCEALSRNGPEVDSKYIGGCKFMAQYVYSCSVTVT